MTGNTDHNHRPFLAMAVIWGALFVGMVALAPAVGGYVLSEFAYSTVDDAAPTAEEASMARARALAERRRRDAMAPPSVAQEPGDLRIAVRHGTRGY